MSFKSLLYLFYSPLRIAGIQQNKTCLPILGYIIVINTIGKLLIDERISGTQSAMIFMAFRSVVTCPGHCSLALYLPNARPTFFDPTNGSVLWCDIVYISPS